MTKTEALKWIRRARLDLRELEAEIRRPGDDWTKEPTVARTYELCNDAIGSVAAIQEHLAPDQMRNYNYLHRRTQGGESS